MSHPFFKFSNVSGVPSRIGDKVWSRLKKVGHGVWGIEDSGSGPVAVRKRDDTARLEAGKSRPPAPGALPDDTYSPFVDPGQLVLLFMGGQRVAARVLENNDGMLKLSTHDGELDNIPQSWVRRADPATAPAPARTITREDMPAVGNPASWADQTQAVTPKLSGPGAQVAEAISTILQSQGGRGMISLGIGRNGNPTWAEFTTGPNGSISVQVGAYQPQVVHKGQYNSINDFVQQFGLTDAGSVRPMSGSGSPVEQ